MCEHKGSSPSPGAPRLAPKRLRVAGTALWIPTESSDPAEPWGGGGDEGASDCVTRGCPVPRRVGDEAGGGCALSLGKQGHHCPLGSGSLDPHFLPLRTAVLPPGGCRGRAPPQKPRERARFFAPPPQGESNTEPPPTQGGGTRAHPRLPSLSLDPPRRQGSELPPHPPPAARPKPACAPSPRVPARCPHPPARPARAGSWLPAEGSPGHLRPFPSQGRRPGGADSPAGLGRGFLGSALRSPRQPLQLWSDAARRSPPPPQFGGGGGRRHVTAEPPSRRAPPSLRSQSWSRGLGGGPHSAACHSRSRRRALCAPFYRSGN